jgi:hypothetical protein
MTVSLIGDGIFLIALAWQVYELSDSATALSLVGLAMTIPTVVFLLIGGVVSDRFDRRRVLIAADVVRALAVAAMGLLSLNHQIELWHIMVLAAFYGGGTAFFGPAFDAIVPDLVATDLLVQANSPASVRPAAWRLHRSGARWLAGGLERGGRLPHRRGHVRRVDRGATSDAPTSAGTPREPGRHVGYRRRARGVPVRQAACVAVGHAGRRGVRVPVVHRPAGGALAAPGEERAGRKRGLPRAILAMAASARSGQRSSWDIEVHLAGS